MKVLFLDIDGVLNSVEYSKKVVRRSLIADPESLDPQACQTLNSLLEEFKDLVVVISSTWRKAYSLEELKQVLQNKGLMVDKIIEYTPVVHNVNRGAEIKQWLESQSVKSNFPVTGIAILDDDADMGELLPYLVQTSVETGLQTLDLVKLKEILNKDFSIFTFIK